MRPPALDDEGLVGGAVVHALHLADRLALVDDGEPEQVDVVELVLAGDLVGVDVHAQVQPAQFLGLVAAGHFGEAQHRPALVEADGLDGQLSPVGAEDPAGGEPRLGLVGVHLDGDLAFEPVWFGHAADHYLFHM